MTDRVYYNPTLGLQNITPALDDETFLFFLGAYYDWMQTTDITFNGSNGPFANGEIITGQDSRATGTIRYVGSNTITVSMKTDVPFDLNEEIVGGTSANSAFVLELSDNVLRQASRIRENKNPEKAQGMFLEYLKNELNKGIPVRTSTDRRRLVSQLRDFFKSKSTEEAYTFLFRALFNETIELRYPGDDLLRVSDGNFLKQSTIRINERGVSQVAGDANVVSGNALVIGTNTEFTLFSTNDYFKIGTQQAVVANVINATHMLATTNFSSSANTQLVYKLLPVDIFSIKNKTIRGRTSGAVGVVADVRASTLGGLPYADVILRLLSGGFVENEIIEDIEEPTANVIVYGVVSSININDGGTGYAVDDNVIISGDGSEATAKVTSVSEAPISKIILANTGIGYRNNVEATINNAGTGGTGFRARISEIANTYTVGANNEYTVGDTVVVRIVNRGSGYLALPTITLQDTAVSALGLLHEKLIRIDDAGTLYEVGDPLVFVNPVGFTGNTAVGRVAAVTERWAETPVILVATEIVEPYKDESLLDDFGSNTVSVEGTGDTEVGILIEGSYYDRLKTEDWRAIGPIERLELSYANGVSAFGSGYTSTSLPTITVTSANGVGANLQAFNIQGKSAIIEIDSGNNIAGIGSIREVTILNQGIDYTNATIDATGSGDGNANLTADISGLFVDSGRFTNDDGKINFKILQDSLFYQDFSYVIRSGLSFDRYRDIVKEVIHPAGLEFFGEIVITSTISLVANFTSEIDADKAPRLTTLFSFLSLFDGIGFPPANQQSIVVRIKPFVSYTDNAKLDTHREVNIEIAPTVINVAALTSTEYRPTIRPSIDVGVFGSSTVEAIPVSPGQSEFDIVLATISASVMLDTAAVREVDITPAAANLQISWVAFEDLSVPKLINLGGTTLDVVPTTRYEIDILPVNTINARYAYGEVPILEFAQTSIAELMGVSFEDYYYYGVGTPTPTLNLLDIDIPLFTSLPITVYESETFGNNFTYKLNVNVASQEHREVVIQPVINIPSTFFNDREFIVKIQNSFDATMAFYSIITTAETDTRTVEIDINLLQNVSVLSHARYKIDIVANQESLVSEFTEVVIKVENFFDATMAFYSIVTTAETDIRTVEIDVNLLQNMTVITHARYEIDLSINSETISSESSNEYLIQIENFFDATMAFYSIITTAETDTRTVEIDVNLFKSVEPALHRKYEIDLKHNDKYNDFTFEELGDLSLALYDDEAIEDDIAWGRSNFISREILYRNLRILGRLSSAPISEFANTQMSSFFAFDNVKKNVKITGTVDVSGNTVIGTNSAFDLEFVDNDPIIIADEKFLVKSVANSTHMELNIPSSTNYTNTFAYREYVV